MLIYNKNRQIRQTYDDKTHIMTIEGGYGTMSSKKRISRLTALFLSAVCILPGMGGLLPVSAAGSEEAFSGREAVVSTDNGIKEDSLSQEHRSGVQEQEETVKAQIPVMTQSPEPESQSLKNVGVYGTFNQCKSDYPMTDDDGDGIYETTIDASPGSYWFIIRLDSAWNDYWGAYSKDRDSTFYSNQYLNATLEEGQQLRIVFDTTRVDEEALANQDSDVHGDSFDFEQYGYQYWTVTCYPVREFRNASQISTAIAALGDEVTVQCDSYNGSGNVEYAVLCQEPGQTVWKTLSSYSQEKSRSFTPDQAGDYTVRVIARDETGNKLRKDFTVRAEDMSSFTSADSFEFSEFQFWNLQTREYESGLKISRFTGTETEVRIPKIVNGKLVRSIGRNAFGYNNTLKRVTLPESMADVEYAAFYGCEQLTEIRVDSGNRYLSALNGILYDRYQKTLICCPCGLSGDVKIPDGVDRILYMAFYGCKKIRSVVIPDGVTYISDAVFGECTNMTEITIPDSVTKIGNNAFGGCSLLSAFRIPAGVTSIGEGAFDGCSGLTEIVIPASVTQIGTNPFANCQNLRNISVYSGNTVYCAVDGVLFNLQQTELLAFSAGRSGSYTVPGTVQVIADDAFSGSRELTEVILPEGLQKIGRSAFENCSSVRNITIPDSVTAIGNWAFYDCDKIRYVRIPSGVTTIGDRAFRSHATVFGASGSAAEQWAKNHGNPFYSTDGLAMDCGTYTVKKSDEDQTVSFPFMAPSDGAYLFRFVSSGSFGVSCKAANDYSYYYRGCTKVYELTRDSFTLFDIKYQTADVTIEIIPAEQEAVSDYGTVSLSKDGNHEIGFLFRARQKGTYLFTFTSEDEFILFGSRPCSGNNQKSEVGIFGERTVKAVELEKEAYYYFRIAGAIPGVSITVSDRLSGTLNAPEGTDGKVPAYEFAGDTVKVWYQGKLSSALSEEGTDLYRIAGSVRTITLSSGITGIDAHTFSAFRQLEKVIIPRTVTMIDDHAFTGNASETILSENLTICGYSGSDAETYALEKNIPFIVMPLENQSVLASESVTVGKSAVVELSADGGKAPYSYAVLYRKAGNAGWTTLQGFKTNARVSFTPDTVGQYEIRVSVKDAAGTVIRRNLNLTVDPVLKNTSRLGAASVRVGEKVKVRCFAEGGAGDYQYAVYYKKSSAAKWTKLRGYGAGNILMLTPQTAVPYDVRVYVKDRNGTIASKTLTLKVL